MAQRPRVGWRLTCGSAHTPRLPSANTACLSLLTLHLRLPLRLPLRLLPLAVAVVMVVVVVVVVVVEGCGSALKACATFRASPRRKSMRGSPQW